MLKSVKDWMKLLSSEGFPSWENVYCHVKINAQGMRRGYHLLDSVILNESIFCKYVPWKAFTVLWLQY